MNLPDLPSNDNEYWEGAKTERHTAKKLPICKEHEYINNKDGTASCGNCPYGVRLPGYMKILKGKIIDLRSVSKS